MSEQQSNKGLKRNNTRFLILTLSSAILAFLIFLFIFYLILKKETNPVFSIGLTLVILSMAALLFMLLRFFKAINLVDHNANLLSQGKLNISDIMADKTKGLETLTIAFNDMKRNLLSFIESTKSNVIILSDAVDKVTKSLDMSFKGNEHIASNMSTVAEKAQEQLKIVKDTLERIQEVSERTNSITNSLANIEGFVENTVKISEEGSEHLDKYNEQMDVISTNLSDTASFIENLSTNLKEIDQVNSLIINITEQLKLLSLNSSVEAARAGEAGRGFVVVAQEMNKLSALTRDSIGQINKLLTNILSSNEKVGDSINNCMTSFNSSKEIFGSVKESFYTINKNANILNEDMKKVYEESRLIDENTKGINEKGLILHDASNEISSITQDVAAVTEEELAENEEINNQALSLQNMLSGIEKLLKRFRTSISPVSQTSPKRIRIAMLSPLDHPFWHGVRQGALYAQNELKAKNADIEYFGFERVDQRFDQLFKEKVEAGYDGVIVPGFAAGLDECAPIAEKKNVHLMAFNCDFREGIKRLSYFGPDVHASGLMAGELVAKATDGEGEYAIITGDLNTNINKVRRDAVLEALRSRKKLKMVAEDEAELSDEAVYQHTKDILTTFPNLKIIVIVTGGISGAAHAIKDLGHLGKTKVICFDYDNAVIELIKEGLVYAAMGQDPFGQGHDPIIALYNYLVAGEVPPNISYTRTEVVDFRSVNE